MPTLSAKAGVSDQTIDEIVRTHWINPAHLRSADFDSYFDERSDALLNLISEAMGKPVMKDDATGEGDGHEFVETPDDAEDEDPEAA